MLPLLQVRTLEVNSLSRDGLSALGLACEAGHVDVVQQLASHATVDVNAGDRAGRTPLVAALEVTMNHCPNAYQYYNVFVLVSRASCQENH